MADPQIQSYRRSMYRSESVNTDLLNLEENLFSYGVYIESGATKEPVTFPEGFGRFIT